MIAGRERWAAETVFRTSSRYRMSLFDRLDNERKEAFRELRAMPQFYGVLEPTVSGEGTFKAVDRETALLLLTLREAGRLPFYVLEGEDTTRRVNQVAQLVLDGVLEARLGERFVSGPEAVSLFSGVAPQGHGRLGRLAHDALQYAEALHLEEIEPATFRLYSYNTLPVTPRWERRFVGAEAVAEAFGLGAGGGRQRRLSSWGARGERRHPADWRVWRRHGARSASATEPTYKLYVSPQPAELEPALDALIEVLSSSRATAFKLAGDAAGLLRSDKLIVYFEDFDGLCAASSELTRRLEGLPAHGVPFSAEIAGDGLLSWGMDPPDSDRGVSWKARESWRLWVTRRLATALVLGARQSSQIGLASFALERLRLSGIDVERWIPDPVIWRGEL